MTARDAATAALDLTVGGITTDATTAAELFAVVPNQTDFLIHDLFVDLMSSVCYGKHLRKIKARTHSIRA